MRWEGKRFGCSSGRWVGTGRTFREVSDEVQKICGPAASGAVACQTRALDTIRNRSLGTEEFRYSDANRNPGCGGQKDLVILTPKDAVD